MFWEICEQHKGALTEILYQRMEGIGSFLMIIRGKILTLIVLAYEWWGNFQCSRGKFFVRVRVDGQRREEMTGHQSVVTTWKVAFNEDHDKQDSVSEDQVRSVPSDGH